MLERSTYGCNRVVFSRCEDTLLANKEMVSGRPLYKLFENDYELRTLIRTRFHFYCAALSTQYDGWLAPVIFVFELLVFHV